MRVKEDRRQIQSDPDSLKPTMICKGFVLHGTIEGANAVRIEGTIVGDISADSVVVGSTGVVQGNIRVNNLIVFGYIEGDVSAIGTVSIKKQGKIIGNLVTKALIVDQGAMYEGVTTMMRSTV